MNKQELIKRIEDLPYTEGPIADTIEINRNWILKSIEQLAESEIGHADEAPRYVKNILARLRELPLHDREVWLKAIMSEFEQDFSRAKWREGYEQGKIEGMVEREKVIVPQCVADWIRKCKMFKHFAVSLSFALQPIVWEENNLSDKCIDWLMDANNQELFARAWLDGYEVEEEKRYLVT
ncbi:phage protein [Streptococcus pneumoniae]|nr:phage protein [Streptococcus pneumoniae]